MIVGAGSASCALAAPNAESGAHAVLVSENGGADAGPPIRKSSATSRPIRVEAAPAAARSIFPRTASGDLSAPLIGAGEMAAERIFGGTLPPPANRRPWVNPRWRESDR